MCRIAHLADVHYRGLSRHAEFREIFGDFAAKARDLHVDHILIAGDIFHTKTSGMTGEYIDQLVWFLKLLSGIAPVHIILGNHDLNLSNLTRQDAVSPIVASMSDPRVHLYKDSGTYEFHPGYVWVHFGIADVESWDRASLAPVPGKVNIACYHGPVQGARIDVGWNVESVMGVGFFEPYDVCMLGDIHTHQFLGRRVMRDGTLQPWIGYPGSACQQNYGEGTEHGFLLWDISARDDVSVRFVELVNPRPYVTVEWTGDVRKLMESVSAYPKKSRIRVRSDSLITQHEIQRIMVAAQRFEPTEITFKIDQQISNEHIDVGFTKLVRDDLRDPAVLLDLVKDYYSDSAQKITDTEWDVIRTTITGYMGSIVDDSEAARNTKWSVRSLEFDDMYSYGIGNRINFDSLDGITGIFGPNRVGKSSVIGALMYTLFNTTDRGPIKNLHVVNVRKSSCRGRAVVNVNGTNYVIERKTEKREGRNGPSANTTLSMHRSDEDGVTEDLVGEQRLDTDKLIRRMIGGSEDFMLTSVSAQGDHNRFITEGDTKRKLILAKFLDLGIFDSMHELAKRDVNDTRVLLRNVPEADWDKEIRDRQAKKNSAQKELSEAVEEADILRAKLEDVQIRLASRSAAGSSVVSETQVRAQKTKVERLEDQMSEASESLESARNELAVLIEKRDKAAGIRKEHDLQTMRTKLEAWRKLEMDAKDLKHIHATERATLDRQERSVRLLETVPCGVQFPTCKFISESFKDKQKIDQQRSRVDAAAVKLDDAMKQIDLLKDPDLPSRIEKLERLSSLETKLSVDISRRESDVGRLEMAMSMYVSSLAKERQILSTYEESMGSGVDGEVIALRKELETIQQSVRDLEARRTSLATDIGRYTAEIEKFVKSAAERRELQVKLRYHEIIAGAFSKKGIPANIVNRQLPVINSEIANILHGIVDFTVELEVDPDGNDVPIYINYGDSRRIIELCSGMEKLIASVAIRVALINVSSLPKTDMFIIDEGFGSLDEGNVEACNRLLVSLKKHFRNVLIVSHVDAIKDVVDNFLEITKNEKDSYVSNV